MPTAFETALAHIAAGSPIDIEADALVAQMTHAERLECLDGDVEFWVGLADMIGGGYVEHTFPGGSCARLGVPGIKFSDGPRGAVIGPATCFPVSMARGASFDVELEERIGEAIGAELRVKGANFFGGVCINLLRHPAWGRAQETYGEDPVLLGEMGAALTRGAQRHVMACAKHYALNSMENTRFSVDVTVDDRVLHEVYLPHFKRVVDEGVASVMSAYNSVNGAWCGENRYLLTDVLREQWGFQGIVISDFIFGLRNAGASVRAGLDIEMPFRMIRAQHLVAQLDAGEITQGEIDEACHRIVATLLRFAPVYQRPGEAAVLCGDAHRALAREAAAKSIVLLRNERTLLPLAPTGSVAVIGRLAAVANLGDRGSSRVNPPYAVTPLDGLRAALGEARVSYCDGDDTAALARVAASADTAVVVVGFTHADEGEYVGLEGTVHLQALYPPQTPEVGQLLTQAFARNQDGERSMGPGGDRASIRLSEADEALIEASTLANPNTVVVIMSGSAVEIESWRHRVGAIVMLWYPGMEGGHALSDVLLGRTCPSGRLPFTIPADEAHLAAFDRRATTATYDRWHGYTKLMHDGNTAAYPFGFGLSYTEFAMGDVYAITDEDATDIVVTVTNVGSAVGAEIVQIYGGLPDSSVERARELLVGFARTPELMPDESCTLTIPIPHSRLTIWNPLEQRLWLEPGNYRLAVARHVGDTAAIEVMTPLPLPI
jgi:beta-glucosidase